MTRTLGAEVCALVALLIAGRRIRMRLAGCQFAAAARDQRRRPRLVSKFQPQLPDVTTFNRIRASGSAT